MASKALKQFIYHAGTRITLEPVTGPGTRNSDLPKPSALPGEGIRALREKVFDRTTPDPLCWVAKPSATPKSDVHEVNSLAVLPKAC